MAGVVGEAIRRAGMLFYVVDPKTSTFNTVEEIPNYINQVVPMFIVFVLMEFVLVRLMNHDHKNPQFRLNDALTSMSHGIVYDLFGTMVRGFTLLGYGWLYERRFIDLDWTSPVTWCVAALGVDLGYYWFHRATHEINLIWASHQVHHSSENYNLTTALRQSMFQRYMAFGIYQPLALLGVPLPAVLVHMQFNLLYQFWIHTEVVRNCGPLEWVLNTPSHHRVHHGANKWCLDKNYAGVLIIWDRMFGTFEPERADEKIAYGLVDHPQSFNVPWLQVFYYGKVWEKAQSMGTWGDFFRALFYGPGWFPGTPRLGDPDTFPDVKAPRPRYDPDIPTWQQVYVVLHFFVIQILHQVFLAKYATFSTLTVLLFFVFLFTSVGVIGAMYDGWWWAPVLEAARCLAYVGYARSTPVIGVEALDMVVLWYFAVSTLIWVSNSLAVVKAAVKGEKLE